MLLLHEIRLDLPPVLRRLDGPVPLLGIPDAVALPQGRGAVIVNLRREALCRVRVGETQRFGEVTLRVTEGDAVDTERLRPVSLPAPLALRVDGARHPLKGPRTLIGRGPRCDVRLDDPTVSAAHAALVCEEGRWCLRDLDSTNGLRLNGALVREASVEAGDILTVGRVSLRVESGPHDAPGGAELIGSSASMRALRDDIARYAPAPYPVLIQGESGSGKELVARALHRASSRPDGPFVAVNCGALAPEVIESELFGHERGAFTGATNRRRGLFEEASEGTLFLDEVGELSPALQTRLLRVLETGEVRRVGGEGSVRVDARVLCATWRDLDAMAADRSFREDLLYRLAVLRLHVPPLAERVSDLPALCTALLERVHSECGRRRVLEDRALATLMLTPWPGNVRELLAVLRRAAYLSDGPTINARHVAAACPRAAALTAEGVRFAPPSLHDDGDAGLLELHERCDGNLSRLSKMTGLARSTLRARLSRAEAARRDTPPSARYDQRR